MLRRPFLITALACLGTAAIGKPSSASGLGSLPENWFAAGSAPTNYEMGLDTTTLYEGKASLALLAKSSAHADGFGTAMQMIDSENYRGKRVKFSGFVRSEHVGGWAGLWMRVDGAANKMLAFDNMSNRSIKGTNDWKSCDIVLDVATGSVDIAFGILLYGSGNVWLAKPDLTIVGPAAPTTGGPLYTSPVLRW